MTRADALVIAQTVEAIATTIGIAAAGVWTYLLFVRRRQRYPRATVSHAVSCFPLEDGRSILRVSARIINTSDVLLCFRYARTRLQHFYPLPTHIADRLNGGDDDPLASGEHELPWTVVAAREWQFPEQRAEVEPGETEVLHCDFVVPAVIERVLLYTYITNHEKRGRDIGWSDTTVVDLKEDMRHATTAATARTGTTMG